MLASVTQHEPGIMHYHHHPQDARAACESGEFACSLVNTASVCAQFPGSLTHHCSSCCTGSTDPSPTLL